MVVLAYIAEAITGGIGLIISFTIGMSRVHNSQGLTILTIICFLFFIIQIFANRVVLVVSLLLLIITVVFTLTHLIVPSGVFDKTTQIIGLFTWIDSVYMYLCFSCWIAVNCLFTYVEAKVRQNVFLYEEYGIRPNRQHHIIVSGKTQKEMKMPKEDEYYEAIKVVCFTAAFLIFLALLLVGKL